MNTLLEIATAQHAKIGTGRSAVFGDIWRCDFERNTVTVRAWGSHREIEVRPEDVEIIDAPDAADFYRICGAQAKKTKRPKRTFNRSLSQSPFRADRASTAPEATAPGDDE